MLPLKTPEPSVAGDSGSTVICAVLPETVDVTLAMPTPVWMTARWATLSPKVAVIVCAAGVAASGASAVKLIESADTLVCVDRPSSPPSPLLLHADNKKSTTRPLHGAHRTHDALLLPSICGDQRSREPADAGLDRTFRRGVD